MAQGVQLTHAIRNYEEGDHIGCSSKHLASLLLKENFLRTEWCTCDIYTKQLVVGIYILVYHVMMVIYCSLLGRNYRQGLKTIEIHSINH